MEGIGIRQYTEKPRGTLCARIVYGVGSLQHNNKGFDKGKEGTE